MIPYNDLRPVTDFLNDACQAAVRRVCNRGIFLGGPEVAEFEEKWAQYCHADFCVTCASGTDALMLASQFLTSVFPKFKIPANTTPFTLRGITRSALTEIVDVSPSDGWPLTDDNAVVPVLLHGRELPKGTISSCLIDACQAHGVFKHDRFSEIAKELSILCAAWSFYPTKNLGAWGDAGAVTCNNPILDLKMRTMRDAWHSRMSEIDAAVLLAKLPFLDQFNAERRRLAEVYWSDLPSDVVPVTRPDDKSNLHIFAIQVEAERRNDLAGFLFEAGIGVKVHYPEPLAKLPGAVSWCNSILSLPLYPGLTKRDISTVSDAIRRFFK